MHHASNTFVFGTVTVSRNDLTGSFHIFRLGSHSLIGFMLTKAWIALTGWNS